MVRAYAWRLTVERAPPDINFHYPETRLPQPSRRIVPPPICAQDLGLAACVLGCSEPPARSVA